MLTDEKTILAEGLLIYLAEVLEDSDGELRLASMDRITSPRSVTDSDGYFYFDDLPTGFYGLVLDTVRESYLLSDPETGNALIFYFEEGDLLDLGVLTYDDLPITPSIK